VALALAACLVLPAAADAAFGTRVLKLGKRGSDVRALQGYLDAAGYTLAQSGSYDRPTRKRVRWFEADHALPVNGVVSRTDAALIKRAANARPSSGGAEFGSRPPTGPAPAGLTIVPGSRAKLLQSGLAAAPADAPDEVKKVIASANEIARLPYKWGGGHGAWTDTGYDCSGSTTYAFRTTFRRGRFPTFGYSRWGLPGPGRWITTYANSGHVFLVVAGLRFDTSGLRIAGSRWTNQMRDTSSFVARHPPGF
jgi:cell wall-associated NlpC family hydrolase